jgi:hypothetical protein
MSGLVPTRPQSPTDRIEEMADQALQRAQDERLAELVAHPKQVEIQYMIDGREATQQELEDMAVLQQSMQEAQQEFLDRLMHTHQRAKAWLGIWERAKARGQRLVTA